MTYNPILVADKFLKEINVKVHKTTLKKSLIKHPNYPSMLSISDSFNEFNVTNQTLKMNKENCNLEKIPTPFIAHLDIDGGKFIIVHKTNEQYLTYSDEQVNAGKIPRANFDVIWSGVILLAKANKESGESDYKQKRVFHTLSKFRSPLLSVAFLLIFILGININKVDLHFCLIAFFKFLGLCVSSLLIFYGFNKTGKAAKLFCSNTKGGCNEILDSDASRLNSWLTWSEVGFFYFLITFLILVFIPDSRLFLALINILAIPYTFYSILYQYRQKNWCVLCCTVQCLFWLDLITQVWLIDRNNLSIFTFLATRDVKIIFSLLIFIPILIWSFIKPILSKSFQFDDQFQQLNQFKFNSDLFHKLLNDQISYVIPNELHNIQLGNSNAVTIITIVSNPFCGPCAKAHKILEKLSRSRDDISVNVIIANLDKEDDNATIFSRHLSALNTKDANVIQSALNDWFERKVKSLDEWMAKYPVNPSFSLSYVTKQQKKWCNEAGIEVTPTVFINGYKLPEAYSVTDLKYLL